MDRVIGELAPAVRSVADALRLLVRRNASGLVETVKWGVPIWAGRKNVICLMLYEDHVNLGFFEGAELGRRHPEIEGTGKRLRHIKVRSVEDVGQPVLPTIIREAVALDERGAEGTARRARPATPGTRRPTGRRAAKRNAGRRPGEPRPRAGRPSTEEIREPTRSRPGLIP